MPFISEEELFDQSYHATLACASAFVAECWFPRALLYEFVETVFPHLNRYHKPIIRHFHNQGVAMLRQKARYIYLFRSVQQHTLLTMREHVDMNSLYNDVEALFYQKLDEWYGFDDPIKSMLVLRHAQVLVDRAMERRSAMAYRLCHVVARTSLLLEDGRAEHYLLKVQQLEATEHPTYAKMDGDAFALLASIEVAPIRRDFARQYVATMIQHNEHQFGMEHPVTVASRATLQKL